MLCWFLLYNNADQPWSIASLLRLPPYPPSHSSRSSGSTRLGAPASILTPDGVYVFLLLSPLVPFFPSPTVSPGPFSTSASPFLPCKQVLQYHFSSLHLHMLMYSCLFLSFWLTSLCITSFSFLHLTVHVLTCHALLPCWANCSSLRVPAKLCATSLKLRSSPWSHWLSCLYPY